MIARTHRSVNLTSKTPVQNTRSQTLVEYNGLKWMDMVQPGSEEVSHLRDEFNFHPLHLEDVLSRLQRPKIDNNPESGGEYVFLVLHFPVFDKANRLAVASELDIFAGRDYIITLHDGRLKPLVRLAKLAADEKFQTQLMGSGSGYLLYRIVEALVNYCFPMIHRIDEKLNYIEVNIFSRDVQSIVRELSFVRRDIIAMRRIIRPNIPVVRSLELRERTFLRLDEEVYFGDLTDGLGKIVDMLEEQKEIIEGLNATIDSLTSHRINEEIKIFTFLTVLPLPVLLISGIMGMNIPIPFQGSPFMLPAMLVVMLILTLAMYAYFHKKHWV